MIQIDIEMPKSCSECLCIRPSDLYGTDFCCLTGDEADYFNRESRPENCPLIAEPKKEQRYSEQIMDDVVGLMDKFLKEHDIWQLLELVADSAAKKEQE